MTTRLLLIALLTVTFVSAGCGDDTTPPADTGAGDGSTDTGTGDGSTDTGAGDGSMDSSMDGTVADGSTDTMADGGCVPADERTWLECTDGIDNDCDGMIDTDPGCSVCPPAAAPEAGDENTMAACTDGIDNDCDGHVDCADYDCLGMATACADEAGDETLCSDGIDNDGDGRIDCGERGCATTMACRPATMGVENDATLCADGLDNDYDGFTDCDDDDCEPTASCGSEDTDATCSDGLDNDGDGRFDCVDSNCSDTTPCMAESGDNCANGMDDDGDGFIDCADRDCLGAAVCVDMEAICDNSTDDDLDGNADCRDSDCESSCSSMACSDTNWFGTCASGTCAMGVCATTTTLADYDFSTDQPLIVVEIMANPDVVSDSNGEYAEILNVSTDTIDVNGLTLNDNTTTNTATISTSWFLSPGERLVFVANDDPTANGGIMGGAAIGSGFFNQGGDEVAIQYMGTDIHRVTYAGTGSDLDNVGLDAVAGQSFNLDQAYLDGTTTTPTWCLTPADAANEYNTDGSTSDYGTPGAANITCP